MHHFPFRIADIDHLTARLSMEEFGGLIRLWMAYLKGEKGPGLEAGNLDFLTGARSTSERRSLAVVIKRFFAVAEEKNCLESEFCEGLIEDYRANGVQSRFANLCRHWEKANKGVPKPSFAQFAVNPDSWFEDDTGRVRKVTGRNPLVLVSESEDSPNLPPLASQPITNNQEPITIGTPIVPKGTPTIDALAESIYAIYPKKSGRVNAIKAIVKVLKAGTLTELELQGRVRAYAEAVKRWTREDLQFVPHPATWFNRGNYDDDPTTWAREPAPAEKKGRGAAALPEVMFGMGTAAAPAAPVGWEVAMAALFGANWETFHPSFEGLLPVDQRQVWAWLKKNEAALVRAGIESPEPCDWREVWAELFDGLPSPETWAGVSDGARREIAARIEKRKKNEGGAA